MIHFAFFGTPEFALPSLEGVHQFCLKNKHQLSMVICQPDKPAHRGKQLHIPPVKVYANQHQLPILQPQTLKKDVKDGDAFFEIFQKSQIDIAIVVAYGHLIPKRFLKISSFGFINVHASLLPRFRGAAPIQKAIEEGDAQTGISIMDLSPEMDAGDIYCQKSLPILPEDDAVSLNQKLAALGKDTLLEALPGILNHTLTKSPQPQTGITYAPKLTKESGKINWELSATQIINQCRAMQPWPGVYTFHKGVKIKLFNPIKISESSKEYKVGQIVSASEMLSVQTASGIVAFHEGQLEGKKRLPIKDLINGYPILINDVLGASSMS